MSLWQMIIVILFVLLGIIAFGKGLLEIKRKNAFGLANIFCILGIFVWGDAFVLGPFWIIVSLLSLILRNWYGFLLTVSVFWVVRSFGEVIYWLHEQFAGKNRNAPHTLKFHFLFQSDAVWFVYQVFWQCILVVSLLATIFLIKSK